MPDLTAADYERLRRIAQRHSRVASEADDLLHDALCVAAEQGRLDLAGVDGPWLRGVIAHLALRRARDGARRRAREQARQRPGARPPPPLPNAAFLKGLPPSARTVAALAINGMTPEEIRHVLRLSDAAYRQRLSVVRRAWRDSDGEAARDTPAEPPFDLGLIRRALLDAARRRGHIASHDPDGNLFLIAPSQNASPREQRGEPPFGSRDSPAP